MDKNHCAKCIHLKRAKKPTVSEHGNRISATCFLLASTIAY